MRNEAYAPIRAPLTLILLTLLALSMADEGLLANPSEELPRFQSKILPIFQTKCLKCHGESLKQNGLDLRSRDSTLKGGESGAAIAPGKAEESLLFKKVSSGQMPFGDGKLSDHEIKLIRHWIDTGALIEGEDPVTARKQLRIPSEKEVMVTILRAKCTVCHGKRRQEAGLDLRTREGLLKGGTSGPVIVPGDPDKSSLIRYVAEGKMPPANIALKDYVRPVTIEELDKLRRWIAGGAPAEVEELVDIENGADPFVKNEDRRFWSFQSPKRPPVPTVKNQHLVRTPIDAFLLDKLEAKGLAFSREADPLLVMRRAYFDLLGLPPDPAELEAYRQDRKPDAYERMIDRLLSSPHYGERWGRHWLDAAGYADSQGKLERDTIRPHAWRYRDYVIRSLNADKPYDQFLMEQIAGDELFDYKSSRQLTPKQIEYLVATGFLRTASDDTDQSELNLVANRMEVLAEQIEIFSSAVMGLSIGCARCHNHKFDPIPQRDYYRFSAVFRTAYDPYDWLIPSDVVYVGGKSEPLPQPFQRFLGCVPESEQREVKEFNTPVLAEIRRLERSLKEKSAPFRQRVLEEKLAQLPETIRNDVHEAVGTPPTRRSALQSYLVEKFSVTADDEELKRRFDDFRQKAEKSAKLIEQERLKLRPEPKIQALFDVGGEPTPTYLLRRGEPNNIGPRVTPGVPSVLTDGLVPYNVIKPSWDTSGQRLALARWLVQPNHPLTARVMVNRIWQHYFGVGLVSTPDNFGNTGTPPSNPALLDWLATEFVHRGWSLKQMHKLILTSTAYRQSSLNEDSHRGADPENLLLSRFPLRRMDAETLRDSVLKISARLNPRQFGPPDEVEVTAEGEVLSKESDHGYRRSIYVLQRRSKPLTMLDVFDGPQMNPNCLTRSRTTVPTQALQMWNAEMLRESAQYFAGRVIDAAGTSVEKQIERVYLTALSRYPTNDEINLGVQAISGFNRDWLTHMAVAMPPEPKNSKSQWLALAAYCHVLLNSPDFIYID